MEKQKELRYAKTLSKDKAEGSSAPYCFDVLVQLANISVRSTLYELLRLFKSTREALREALADAAEAEDEENYLHASQYVPCITFTSDDM